MSKQRSGVRDQGSAAVLDAELVNSADAANSANVAALPVPVPVLGEVVTVGQVREIALDRLDANPKNLRKTFDPQKLGELAASIRAVGVTNPLIVRRGWNLPAAEAAGDFRYEIVAGHRRREALELLGWTTAPCIERELTDEQAAEIGLVDNLQRADVDPLEEAVGFEELVKAYGSVSAAASRAGKDLAYVTQRLKLLTLTLNVRDALTLRLITVDHALLLTKLGAGEQDEALKWCLDRNVGSRTDCAAVVKERAEVRDREQGSRGKSMGYVWEPESVLRLKGHIESSSGRKLSAAPWDLDDAQLVWEAGACSVCPKNTNANGLLFGDLDVEEATCTDGACFKAKTEAFVAIKLSAAPDGVVRLSWKQTSTPPRMDKETGRPTVTQIFKQGQWVEAKKGSCEHVRPGVAADWEDDANRGYMGSSDDKHRKPGAELLICVAPKCKAHKKEWEKPKSRDQGSGNRGQDEAAQEEKRAAALAETKLRVRLMGAAMEKIVKLHADSLRLVVLQQLPKWGHTSIESALVPGFLKVSQTANVDSPEFARCVVLAALNTQLIRVGEREEVSARRPEFLKLLKSLGYDGSKAWDEAKKAASPVPKPAKKAAKRPSAAARKKIADAAKKRWADAAKKRAGVRK